MSGWVIAGIIAGALILLSFTPFSVVVRSEGTTDSTRVWLWIGFLRFDLLTRLTKPKKPKKKAEKEKPEEDKPDRASALRRYVQGFDDIKTLASLLTRLLKRALRVFRIGKLRLFLTVATNDAAGTALWFGRANIAAGTLLPLLYQYLRIRNDRIRIDADFQRDKTLVSLHLRVTTTPAALFLLAAYAVFALLGYILPRRLRSTAAKPDVPVNQT